MIGDDYIIGLKINDLRRSLDNALKIQSSPMMPNDSTLPRLGTPPEKLAEDRGGNRRGPIQTFFSVSGFFEGPNGGQK
jgi:hypothetical protein